VAQDYYTILTNAGLAYEAQQKAQNKPITLVTMAIGDGNGAAYNPDPIATTLRREVHRQPINSLLQDANNPTWLVAEVWLADDVGGWTIREVGIYTDTGVLYAIAKYPESIKPLLASGSGKQFYVRTIFQTSNTSSVVLQVDNSVVMATRAFVEGYVRDELAKLDSKQSVRVATAGNIALTGLQTIDGVVLAAGDRVLVKDQTAAKDNGIYIAAGGVWTRAADADTAAKLTAELCVGVEQGTVNGDSLWMLTTDAPIVLGSTALAFEVAGGRPLATKAWVQALTASGTRRGIVELAEISEAEAATDTERAVTPAGLASYVRGYMPLGPEKDLNTITKRGFYGQAADMYATSGNNYPGPFAGTLLVQQAGEEIISQMYTVYATGDVYVRAFYQGWKSWRLLVAGDRRVNVGLGLTGGGVLGQDISIGLATPGTLNGGTSNSATAAGHTHALSPASESLAGVSMLASQAVAEAGVDTSRPMAALRVLQLIRAAVSSATELLRGVMRVATKSEVINGELDNAAVTPLKLAQFMDAMRNVSVHLSNGNFVVPAGVKKLFLTGCGGGGGGGGGAADSNFHGGGGGGGGGGFMFRRACAVTPGQTLSVVIGAGGSGGAGGSSNSSGANGTSGGATTIAEVGIVLGGGIGGRGTRLDLWANVGGPGAGGSGGGGDMTGSGGSGGVGNLSPGSAATMPFGGGGGGGLFGPGGVTAGWSWAGAGTPSASYGGGGGGGQASNIGAAGSGGIGGKGGNGILIIEW